MLRFFLVAVAAIASLSASACSPRSRGVPAHVLAAADPSAAEAPFSRPESAVEDARPRTLSIEIADPAGMKRPETPPENGTGETVYSCPMHPEVRDTKPGSCPKCGMTLEPVTKPTPIPTATSKPRPTPSATPTPGGHEHHHGSSS